MKILPLSLGSLCWMSLLLCRPARPVQVATNAPRTLVQYHRLSWEEVFDTSSLDFGTRMAIAKAPLLEPMNWGVRIASDSVFGVTFLFLEGKIGGGTGYEARGFYVYGPERNHRRPLAWSGIAGMKLEPSEYLPSGIQPFSLDGCLYVVDGQVLGYAIAGHDTNTTSRSEIQSDSLARSPGLYRWSDTMERFAFETPADDRLEAECKHDFSRR